MPNIMDKVKKKEEISDNYNRCIAQGICPHCGGDLYEDSDIGTFIEVECDSCDFSYCTRGHGHYSTI